MKPLVGDDVEIDILDETEKKGNITEICPRENELLRPAVANIDQALLVFAVSEPKPNLNLLDRFLVSMGVQNIPVTICFNKKDLGSGQDLADIGGIYRDCGFPVLFTSAARQAPWQDLPAPENRRLSIPCSKMYRWKRGTSAERSDGENIRPGILS